MIWNFTYLSKNENNIKTFAFTKNISENINKYINRNLRRGKCSSMLFGKSILDIISKFNNKIENNTNNTIKSDIIKFYINKCNEDYDISYSDEIKKLEIEYEK